MTRLDLSFNDKIGADGWRALAEAIEAGGARAALAVADLGRRRAEEGVRGAWMPSQNHLARNRAQPRGAT